MTFSYFDLKTEIDFINMTMYFKWKKNKYNIANQRLKYCLSGQRDESRKIEFCILQIIQESSFLYLYKEPSKKKIWNIFQVFYTSYKMHDC